MKSIFTKISMETRVKQRFKNKNSLLFALYKFVLKSQIPLLSATLKWNLTLPNVL